MRLQNWAGNVVFTADRLHTPATVEELQALVASTERIRALGSAHSFNRIADTPGELVTVTGLPPTISIDEAARTVDVAAGLRYGELAVELDARGWALHNLGSLPHISIAGAAATGTHGSGNANACLAAAAVAVEFVRGDGELVRVRRGDAAFGGSVLALGALGIVTRLTLAIQPTYRVRQDVWLDLPLAGALDRFDEIMGAGHSVSLFTTWARPDTVDQVWVKSLADGPVADGREWGAVAATTPQHPITGADASAATEQLGVPGPWYARLPHFRLDFTPSSGDEQQTEYLLPREHAAAALTAVQGLDLSPALMICEVRTIAADELWLSPFRGRDSVALHFTWLDDDALVQPLVAAIEDALEPFDPRPHWGKVFRADPSQKYAEQLVGFRELAATHDPNRRFGNEFLQRHVYG